MAAQCPSELLLSIFSLLPIKSIARAGAVCRRWNRLCHTLQLQPLELDLAQHFSSSRESINELVGSVDLCLRLLGANNLKGFKLVFSLSMDQMIMSELRNCLQRVVEKGIESLELDFCIEDELAEAEVKIFKLPSCLFGCNTLTHLKLSRSDFTIPSDFSGFSLLKELRLVSVNITDETLEMMLATCPSMEMLYLMDCTQLDMIRICGNTLQLKSLAVIDMFARELEIHAPHLRTFHFNGDSDFNITNAASLVDAIVCAVPSEIYSFSSNWLDVLYKFTRIEMLTLCGKIIEDMFFEREYEHEIVPIAFSNLHELQILLFQGLQDSSLFEFYNFFQHCTFPSLEKLFVEFDPLGFNKPVVDGSYEADLPDQMFYNLRMVKINGFHGYRNQIIFVEFLLQRAVALELLVLVAPAQDENAASPPLLSRVLEQLLIFPKASLKAQILLYEYGQDDNLAAMHTKSQYAPPSPRFCANYNPFLT